MRKIKILLSLVMIVALSFSMMTFNAFANEATLYGKNDAEVSLSTATHIINGSGKTASVANSVHYIRKGASEMALFEVTLPTLEEGQTLRDVNLFYKLAIGYDVEVYKAGSDAANWTKFADAATIMNDYETYGIKNCVTSSDGWFKADVTAYANELALAKEPKMYVAITVPSGTEQLSLGFGSTGYTRPYTKAIVHTPNGAEASSVKIAQYQAPTYEDSNFSTSTYAINGSSKTSVANGSHYIRKGASEMALFEVTLPALENNQTIDSCNVYYKLAVGHTSNIYKAGSDAANWTKYADAATVMNDYDTYGIKDCVSKADGWFIADVTEYANELILAKEPKMYIALTIPSGTEQITLGFSSTGYTRPYTTATVKTTPVINYDELTSLNEVKAGTSYVAMSDVKNALSKDGEVIILIAQYKSVGGINELVALTPFEAKTVAAKTESEIISTIPVEIDEEATAVKAFIWGASDADPLAVCVSAQVAAAE